MTETLNNQVATKIVSSFIIGLTGGIGSGKSTVANLFASHGINIIDADKIARNIVETEQPVLDKIVKKFGQDILDSQGHLNRLALREIIFADPNKRQWLEQLIHPLIYSEMQQQADRALSPYCIQVIPLLTKLNKKRVQRVLVVDSSETEQIKRVSERDKINHVQAQAILNAQITREQRLLLADDVILNDNHLESLKQAVEKLHALYLKLAEKSISPS